MLKKMLLVSCLGFTLLSTGTLPTPAYVIYGAERIDTVTICKAENTILPRAEQTEWRVREVDGRWQKRLWSLTYGKWLTDWEWI